MVAIRLSPEMEARLEAVAKRTGRTKANLAREAINERIGVLEDLYLPENRYSDILSGKSKTLPLEDLIREFGLED